MRAIDTLFKRAHFKSDVESKLHFHMFQLATSEKKRITKSATNVLIVTNVLYFVKAGAVFSYENTNRCFTVTMRAQKKFVSRFPWINCFVSLLSRVSRL